METSGAGATRNPAWPQKASHSLRPASAPLRRGVRRSRDVRNLAEPESAGTSVAGGDDEIGNNSSTKPPKIWKGMRSAAPDHQPWKESVAKIPGSEYYNRNAYEVSSMEQLKFDQQLYRSYSRADNPLQRSYASGTHPNVTLRGVPLPGSSSGGYAAPDEEQTGGPRGSGNSNMASRLERTAAGEFRRPQTGGLHLRTFDGHERTLTVGLTVKKDPDSTFGEAYGDNTGSFGTAAMRASGRMRLGRGQQGLTADPVAANDEAAAGLHEVEGTSSGALELQLYSQQKAAQYLGTTGFERLPNGDASNEKVVVKLPLGWTKHRSTPEDGGVAGDAKRSKAFYYNRFTGESRWERPTAVDVSDMMYTEPATKRKQELNEQNTKEQAQQIAAIEQNVVEGDGLHDVDENLPDIVLFFIIIYRYLRMNYRRLQKQLKKAFEKQVDEEVMAILMRENEAFALTHMGVGVDLVEYVEPLETRKIPQSATVHPFLSEAEAKTLLLRMPALGDGFEHFKTWTMEVGRRTREIGRDAWIRSLWERLNYQAEDEERGKVPAKSYSLASLQEEHGGLEHCVLMERELRERVLEICSEKASTYEKLALKQRTGTAQDMARLKEAQSTLHREQQDLAKLRKQKEEVSRVLKRVDNSYDTRKLDR
ncbi:unnamed protein product [Amoebophrya sp. A120]|nr:unnamed protein product [Amoebophrya sp. A120]|eukprot:GSA120T00015186001.1